MQRNCNGAPERLGAVLVVFGGFLSNVFSSGMLLSHPIIQLDIVREYADSRVLADSIYSVKYGFSLMSGIAVGFLLTIFSHRQVIISGSLIIFVAYIITSQLHDIRAIILVYGICAGTAHGMVVYSALLAINIRFTTSRAFATGVSLSGAGIGTLGLSFFIKLMLNQYGWRSTVLILGAAELHCVCAGLLLSPVMIGSTREVVVTSASGVESFSIEEKRIIVVSPEEGDQIIDDEHNVALASKSQSEMLSEENQICVTSAKEGDQMIGNEQYVLLTSKSQSEMLSDENQICVTSAKEGDQVIGDEQNVVVTSYLEGETVICAKKQAPMVTSGGDDKVTGQDNDVVLGFVNERHSVNDQECYAQIVSLKNNRMDDVGNSEDTKLQSEMSNEKNVNHSRRLIGSHDDVRNFQFKNKHLCLNNVKSENRPYFVEFRSLKEIHLQSDKDSLYCRTIDSRYGRSLQNLVTLGLSYSDCMFQKHSDKLRENPGLYLSDKHLKQNDCYTTNKSHQNGGHIIATIENGCQSTTQSIPNGLTSTLSSNNNEYYVALSRELEDTQQDGRTKTTENTNDNSRMRTVLRRISNNEAIRHLVVSFRDKNFICLFFTNFTWAAHPILTFYIPAMIVASGLDADVAVTANSVSGITNMIGRILMGLIASYLSINSLTLYGAAQLVTLTVILAFPWLQDPAAFIFFSALSGLSFSTCVTLRAILLIDVLGLEVLPQSYCSVIVMQGVATMIHQVVTGCILEATSAYVGPMMVLAVLYVISLCVTVYLYCRKSTFYKPPLNCDDVSIKNDEVSL